MSLHQKCSCLVYCEFMNL
uniref:Uncharacterized protein n=1 Tax=Anguilla anguilla TaxID=7936 RepID=A0A0E9U517_ANGAN